MICLNDLFDYGYKIFQDDRYFKFSIDSILLAEFVKFKEGNRILDLCTGNAPIPLILITKCQNLYIDAIEIQPAIFDLAKKSIKYNDLEKSINVINEDAKKYTGEEKYDIVVCNPPYFKVTDTSLKNVDPIKQIARHEMAITLEEIIFTAKKNLKETGTLYLVHRVDRFLETIKILEKAKFGIRNSIFIHTKKGSNAEFFLLEASKYKKSDLKVKSIDISDKKTYKNIFEEGSI